MYLHWGEWPERSNRKYLSVPLHWRHNGRGGVPKHKSHDCLLNRWFRRRSKKTSKPRVTGLRAGNSPMTGEFPAQMASNAENVSIWWRHHDSEEHRHHWGLSNFKLRRQTPWSTLVQAMACCLFGTKPLPEPVLTYCYLGSSWKHSSVKYE